MGIDSWFVFFNIGGEILFLLRRFSQVLKLCRYLNSLFAGLAQNVTNALAGRPDGLEFRHIRDVFHRFGASPRIHYVIVANSEHSLDNVVGESTDIAQEKLQSLPEKCLRALVEILIGRKLLFCIRALITRSRVAHKVGQKKWQLVVSNCLNDTVGLAAKGKRIFGSGGL